MDSKKHLEKQLRNYLLDLFSREITNSNLSNFEIIDVKLTEDGQTANILYNTSKNKDRVIEALDKTKPYLRKEISKNWPKRRVPHLNFVYDKNGAQTNKVLELLDQIAKEDK